MLRSFKNFKKASVIKAHTLFTGGVTAIAFSNTRSSLYSAGADGSWMVWTIGSNPNPTRPIELEENAGRNLQHLESMQRTAYDRLQIFQDVLQEEFRKNQEEAKENFRQTLLAELN